MVALTKDIDTPQRVGDLFVHGVAATKKCYAGGIAVRNASGYAEPGTLATGLVALGRIEDQADNTSGANGDVAVTVRRGVFKFDNSGTNAVAITHIGTNCYIEDDHTVGSLATGMSVAGKVLNVDSDGVWVEIQ